MNKSDNLHFERRELKSGQPNPKYVDVLEVDKPISGQQYCCMSFISPEQILVQKEHFKFEQFVKGWGLHQSMNTFSKFLSYISYKYSMDTSEINAEFEDFVKNEEADIKSISIKDQYQFYLDKNGEDLDKKFDIQNKFNTSVRAVKNRGNFATAEEAQLRAKILREKDPNFDIYVGAVGQWLVWHPTALKAGQTEYLEEELNQLVHEKEKNEAIAKSEFDKRVLDAKRKAIADNVEKAKKSGNKLTQTIDEQGNLIGVNNTQEVALKSLNNVTESNIREELFEGDNIILKPGDHGEKRVASAIAASSAMSASSPASST